MLLSNSPDFVQAFNVAAGATIGVLAGLGIAILCAALLLFVLFIVLVIVVATAGVISGLRHGR